MIARDGFHRIGRLDSTGRRSLWLREEEDAIELRAGREGDDAHVRITSDHPLYHELRDVMACARFAAEWEDQKGRGLAESYALDRHPASLHRATEIDQLLAEFREKHGHLHREWTAAVGTPGYVKAPWRDRDNELVREYREKLTAAGYPKEYPLLPGGAR